MVHNGQNPHVPEGQSRIVEIVDRVDDDKTRRD